MSAIYFDSKNMIISDTSNGYIVIEVMDDLYVSSCLFDVDHKDAYEFFTRLSKDCEEIAKIYKESRG